MALYARWTELCDDFDRCIALFRGFAASRRTISGPGDFSLQDECFLEGALSRTWQAWNAFCRACVCESCMGTVDGSGIPVVGLANALSEQHVSGAAMKAKPIGFTGPYWGATNLVMRYEPTWGDVDVLDRIVQRLGPANHAQLRAAMSTWAASSKRLQTIRNAAAHNNHETMAAVLALRSSSVAFPIAHPVHALFWLDPASRDFLAVSCVEGLREAGLGAIGG